MFTTHHIAKGFATALMLILFGSAPAFAQQSSAPPVEYYLQYDWTLYLNLITGSSHGYQDWRPNSAVESSYRGLFDYAPNAVEYASPMIDATPGPYIGYDLTPYYNLAPGCPSNDIPDDVTPICYAHPLSHKVRTISILMIPM